MSLVEKKSLYDRHVKDVLGGTVGQVPLDASPYYMDGGKFEGGKELSPFKSTNPGTNEINSNYGSLVIGEQLEWVINSLRSDKNTRQAIAFFNRPQFQFEGNKDFVCTMYANFFIRNNKLNMKVQMRSNDMFYGLTFDAPFFAFLHQSVYHCLLDLYTDLELGNYYHCADNMHFYEKHFNLAEKIISSTAKNKVYALKFIS